jgi:NAD(P) transhydrogenase subunit alpha
MILGIPKESLEGETRVAMTPPLIAALERKGHQVLVESGAGLGSFFSDDEYRKAGATLIPHADAVYQASDVVCKVQPPTPSEAGAIRRGAAYIGLLAPLTNHEVVRIFARNGVTAFAMEYIPRISRAQSMDALSSQATIAGYKAVLIAARQLPKIFPLLMTAAGSIQPATVFVLGAGVAGLQAIATARRLGAKVEAFDPRPAVKEQVESLGASFVEMELPKEDVETAGGYAKEQSDAFLRKEQEAIAARLPKVDVVVSTAQIFGKKAPVLITEDMVRCMRPGSVIVDLAAEQGGNCALTSTNRLIRAHGVTIYGAVNLPATVPVHASQMYAKNVSNLFLHLYSRGDGMLDFEDEITSGACITHAGAVINESIRKTIEGAKE